MWMNAYAPRSDVPPANWAQCSRALLHHVSLTCGWMHMNPGQMYFPANWTQFYRALLHHVGFTCEWMHMYPGQMYPFPTKQTQCYKALLHHHSLTCTRMQTYPGHMYTPLLIEPSATELYYTMSVWYVEECRCTQVRCNPPPNRALLHHVNLTCRRMQAYPGQM